ncbi:hypothetical protein [Arthrobacter sp. AZCC_0090]|uniref:hypothetical protein n=1 Tax=Arthrobacter sp. AZCC_0090 TaxID=2735881 RepID=UPI00161B66FD|nr:hypothetical protein [Arthrobacter sp. AZCC_0090]MBB6406522.1 hypothetical protein [Arthrobacter sp. AZCC_0090]
MAELIYLESMDSVRATWSSGDDVKAAAYAQAFVESLLNLAMGRNIVVQRSFAFDSLAFQRVLSDLVEAYESFDKSALIDANRSAPVLLHLNGAPSFRHAVAETVWRISGARGGASDSSRVTAPFQSSMYPDLHDQPGLSAVASRIETGRPELFQALLDPERALLFERLWKWFGSAKAAGSPIETHKIVDARATAAQGIKDMVEPFLNHSAWLSADLKVSGIADLDLVGGIVESLRTLRDHAGTAAEDPFTYRSRLYGNQHWFESGATAEQLIGIGRLFSVRELINTMYNMVCKDSIGIVDASFTTEMVDPARLEDQFTAQALAGLAYDKVTGGGLWRHAVGVGAPQVDVQIEATSEKTRTAVVDVIGRTQRQAAFRRVLEMRDEPTWQTSLLQLNRARVAKDSRAFERALQRHRDVVALGLSEICEVDTRGGRLQAMVKGIPAAGAIYDVWGSIHDGHKYNATELASSLGTGMPGVMSTFNAHRNQRVLKRSLGEIVTARGQVQ